MDPMVDADGLPSGAVRDKATLPSRTGLCGPPELVLRRLQHAAEAVIPEVGVAAGLGGAVADVLRQRMASNGAELHAAVRHAVGLHRITKLVLSYLPEAQLLCTTASGGRAHSSSGTANVDLFFYTNRQSLLGPNTPLELKLQKAWGEDPEVCLKLIFYLGARVGKQDRYGFYDACLWLHAKQPATLLANLEHVQSFACWKGLCEIVARVCEGSKAHSRDRAFVYRRVLEEPRMTADDGHRKWLGGDRLQQAAFALQRYHEDPLYRALHNKVASLFAEQLLEDLQTMKQGKRLWSLAAKWCPILGNSFDRRTLLCESIARRMFPAELPEYAELPEAHYAFRVRDRLRKEVLSPLKAYRQEPAVLISKGQWSKLDYARMPAECMRLHEKAFERHDAVRFEQYKEKVKAGKAQVKRGQQQPHQLLKAMGKADNSVAVGQWKDLVGAMSTSGCTSLACCDVSYSMEADAMPGVSCLDVAVALTVLISELPGEYKDRALTFASRPEIRKLRGSPTERAAALRAFPWERTTDLFAVFRLLLDSAAPPPARLFIFSDMDFNAALGRDASELHTDLEEARRRFAKAGRRMPEVVFWNLAGGTGAPALATMSGCALVAGFSPTILKLILAKDRINPMTTVAAALSGHGYEKLRVVSEDPAARAVVRGCLEDRAEVITRALEAPAAPAPAAAGPITVDLCIVMDCTGSMGSEIEAAKSSILRIADLIQAEVGRRTRQPAEVRLACVAYRDFCDGQDRLQSIEFQASDAQGHARVRDFIAKQHASGGGDMPEDVFGGLDLALRFSWRSQLRFLLLVADAPGHGALYGSVGDSLPRGDPFGLTHQGLMMRMAQEDISLLFLGVGKEADRMVHFLERCHQNGPVTRMSMSRNVADYALAFEERVGSAIVRKIASALDGPGTVAHGGGPSRTKKQQVLQVSAQIVAGLSREEAAKCLGNGGRVVKEVRRALLEKLEMMRPRPRDAGGRAGKARPRRGGPKLWLDLRSSQTVVRLTLQLRANPEEVQVIWKRLAAEAKQLLDSFQVKGAAPSQPDAVPVVCQASAMASEAAAREIKDEPRPRRRSGTKRGTKRPYRRHAGPLGDDEEDSDLHLSLARDLRYEARCLHSLPSGTRRTHVARGSSSAAGGARSCAPFRRVGLKIGDLVSAHFPMEGGKAGSSKGDGPAKGKSHGKSRRGYPAMVVGVPSKHKVMVTFAGKGQIEVPLTWVRPRGKTAGAHGHREDWRSGAE